VPGLPNDSSVKAQLEAEYQKIVQDLTSQVNELNGVMDQVTKEREFYFNKLREIEVLVQQNLDGDIDATSASYLKTIQDILYKTEEGFEIPTADA
jgi:RP/EB family microtubule-associated protein